VILAGAGLCVRPRFVHLRQMALNQQATTLRELLSQRHRRTGPPCARTIAVASGSDGVGKSTFAANLAVALQLRGLRVALVVLEPEGKPRLTLEHVLDGRRTVADVVLDGPGGVRIVPAGLGIDQLANLTPWQHERLWQGFTQLDAEADLVLIETPAGTEPEALDTLAAVPEIIVVTVPDAAAVADAYALVKVLAGRNPDATIHLAINRARSPMEAQSAAARIIRVAQRFLGRRLSSLGFVLEDPEVQRAQTAGAVGRQRDRRREPLVFVTAHPGSVAARCVRHIADRLSRPTRGAAARSLSDCMQAVARTQFDHLASRGEP